MASGIVPSLKMCKMNMSGFISKIREKESLYTVPIPQSASIFHKLASSCSPCQAPQNSPGVRYMQKASNNCTFVVKNVTQGYVERAGNVEFLIEGNLIQNYDRPQPIPKKSQAAKHGAIPNVQYVPPTTPPHVRQKSRNKTQTFVSHIDSR